MKFLNAFAIITNKSLLNFDRRSAIKWFLQSTETSLQCLTVRFQSAYNAYLNYF